MRVEQVYHRPDAIWPFTVVGRPPQEDSMFGALIHELVGPVLPGADSRRAGGARRGCGGRASAAVGHRQRALRALRRPPAGRGNCSRRANALLGQGQLSLAKYLLIVAGEDNPELDVRNVPDFLRHVLERVDWRRDLHFQTCTTIDTLDYSGERLNEGSKVVIAAAGPPLRTLPVAMRQPARAARGAGLPPAAGFFAGHSGGRGAGWKARTAAEPDRAVERFCAAWNRRDAINGFPLVVVVDQTTLPPGRSTIFCGPPSRAAIRRPISTASSRSCATSIGAVSARW